MRTSTSATRASRPPLGHDVEVLTEHFEVTPRLGVEPPAAQDAHRVAAMRRTTAARLRHHGLGALEVDATLIVSELLTNALLHSGARRITLHITVQDGFVRICVNDGMPGAATRRQAPDNAESGRGLALVEALAEEHGGCWGTSEDGTETWCSLAVLAAW